jgi:uncharacterized membrane protein YecN with MAPEG domain
MSPTITALYGGLLGILYMVLCWQVVMQRRRAKVGIGVGGDTALERAVRVHGNFAEYAPLFIVLLLVAELNAGTPVLLHVLGAVFVLARIGHALGLGRSSGVSKGRFYGTLVTWIALLVLAVLNIRLAFA